MKLLIELPTWLGDTVMATPAIENLVNHFSNVEITLLGSTVSIGTLRNHPNVIKTYILDRKINNLYRTVKNLGGFDLFISFRSSFRSKFVKFFITADKKYQFDASKYDKDHQVEKYNNFINDAMSINNPTGKLLLHIKKKKKIGKNKLLGINPGASYGSAKRWYPKEFADLAYNLSDQYDIVIFGGKEEKDIAADIEQYLIQKGVNNYQNLADSLTIQELISEIANLDLLLVIVGQCI